MNMDTLNSIDFSGRKTEVECSNCGRSTFYKNAVVNSSRFNNLAIEGHYGYLDIIYYRTSE